MQAKKIEKFNNDYWLAKCAFHWTENDVAAARDAWETGNACFRRIPDAGAFNFDRDCYRWMKAILDAAPEAAVTVAERSHTIAREFELIPASAE